MLIFSIIVLYTLRYSIYISKGELSIELFFSVTCVHKESAVAFF